MIFKVHSAGISTVDCTVLCCTVMIDTVQRGRLPRLAMIIPLIPKSVMLAPLSFFDFKGRSRPALTVKEVLRRITSTPVKYDTLLYRK